MHDYAAIIAQAYGRPQPAWRLLPYETVVAAEHEFAVHYHRGRLLGVLPTGLHRLWGRHHEIRRLDRRRQILEVPAQEVASADGVTVKATAQVVWQIMDPLAALGRDADHAQTLYAAAHQAVRVAVGARPLAAIATQRAEIAAAMREAIAPAVAGIGLAVHEAHIKDLMPNAETRKAMAAVAFAKAEALAALEKARGEQAALRALANAARLVREQPELARLRGLQVLGEGLRAGGRMVVTAGDLGLAGEAP